MPRIEYCREAGQCPLLFMRDHQKRSGRIRCRVPIDAIQRDWCIHQDVTDTASYLMVMPTITISKHARFARNMLLQLRCQCPPISRSDDVQSQPPLALEAVDQACLRIISISLQQIAMKLENIYMSGLQENETALVQSYGDKKLYENCL